MHTVGPAPELEVKIRVLAAQALDLLEQRRLRLGRDAAERPLQRPPQVHQRGLQLGGDPLARLGRELGRAREHELHAEQPLDHALVHVAREVDPLLQLARAGALPVVATRASVASAAVLPSVHSR